MGVIFLGSILNELNEVTLNIAGLCSETVMDTFYTMVNGDMGLKRFFSGNFGWKIYWDKSLNVFLTQSLFR